MNSIIILPNKFRRPYLFTSMMITKHAVSLANQMYRPFSNTQPCAPTKHVLQKNVVPVSPSVEMEDGKDLPSSLDNNQNTITQHPYKLKKSVKQRLYLKCSETAKEIALCICRNKASEMKFVAEMNPGWGLITQNLLANGIPSISMFEENIKFHQLLNEMVQQNPTRLTLSPYSLLKFTELKSLQNDNINTNNTHNTPGLQEIVPLKDWSSETYMQVIGISQTSAFLRGIIYSVIFQSFLMKNGRPMFYLMIPSEIWNKLADEKGTNRKSGTRILFQLLFKYECLGHIKPDAYTLTTNPHTKSNLKRDALMINEQGFCLVKFEPKSDLFTHYMKRSDLLLLWHFVKQHCSLPNNRVIPELEKLTPGCGPRLIMMNLNLYTQFADLSANQCLEIYKAFRSWPEFQHSSFVPSLNTVLLDLTKDPFFQMNYNYDFLDQSLEHLFPTLGTSCNGMYF